MTRLNAQPIKLTCAKAIVSRDLARKSSHMCDKLLELKTANDAQNMISLMFSGITIEEFLNVVRGSQFIHVTALCEQENEFHTILINDHSCAAVNGERCFVSNLGYLGLAVSMIFSWYLIGGGPLVRG